MPLIRHLPPWLLLLLALSGTVKAATLTDIADRTIEVDVPVTRMTIDDGRNLVALALLHADPGRWLAAWPHDTHRIGAHFYQALEQVSPTLAETPKIASNAGSFNLETLLAVAPDVAVFSLGNGVTDSQLQLMAQVGIPSVFVDFFDHPLQNQARSLQLLGRLSGADARAQAFIAFRQQHLAEISRRVATLAPEDYPSVFLEAHAGISDDCCFSPGRGNLGDYIAFVGGHNIGADVIKGVSGTLSLEYLISRQPDVYIATGGPQLSGKGLAVGPGIDAQQAQASLRQILGRTGIAQLNATGNGRAHGLSHLLLNSPLDIVAVELLARWIHPQLFADLDPARTLHEIEQRFLPVPYSGTHWISTRPGSDPDTSDAAHQPEARP